MRFFSSRLAVCLLLAAMVLYTGCGSKQAPDEFRVKFETTKGDFTVEVIRAWSPLGADRFYELIQNGFYNGDRFFRVLPGFVVQFGMNGDPAKDAEWETKRIMDDPPARSNTAGTLVFAKTGEPNSRTTQVFINLADNARLDSQGFTPFGRITQGMDVVQQFYSGYGEGAPMGAGPNQNRIRSEGNPYLQKEFPQLDYIKKASIVE